MKNQPATTLTLIIEKETISRADLGSIAYLQADLVNALPDTIGQLSTLTITATSVNNL